MLSSFVLFAEDAVPATDKAAQQPPGPGNMLFFMAAMFIAMFCFMILPARRQRKEQEAMLASLKTGTKVATTSGVIGVIEQIKDGDDEFVIRSEGTKLRMSRAAIARVIPATPEAV